MLSSLFSTTRPLASADPDIENGIGINTSSANSTKSHHEANPIDKVLSPEDMTIDCVRDLATRHRDFPYMVFFRRFDRLHIFNLIAMQNKLRLLEEKLDHKKMRGIKLSAEQPFLDEIRDALKDYDDALAGQATLNSYSMPQVDKWEYVKSLFNPKLSGNARELYNIPLTDRDIEKRNKRLQDWRDGVGESWEGWTAGDPLPPRPTNMHDYRDYYCCPGQEDLGFIARFMNISFISRRDFNNTKHGLEKSTLIPVHILKSYENMIINSLVLILLLGSIYTLKFLNSTIAKNVFLAIFVCLILVAVTFPSDTATRGNLAALAQFSAILVVFIAQDKK